MYLPQHDPELIYDDIPPLYNSDEIIGLLAGECDEDRHGNDFESLSERGLIDSIMADIEDDPESIKELLAAIINKKDSLPKTYAKLKSAVDEFVERGGEWM